MKRGGKILNAGCKDMGQYGEKAAVMRVHLVQDH